MVKAIHKSLRKWLSCEKCADLAAWRHSVVIGCGSIPARVLYIGEAPGKTEDTLGLPFKGTAGILFRQGRVDAADLVGVKRPPSCFATNVIACRPCDEWRGPNRAPYPQEIDNCRPRLAKIVGLVRPEAVVFLGDVAERNAKKLCPDGVKIRHPAFVARRGGIGSIDYKIFIRALADVYESLRGE
jgi:DNA polymerase